VREAVAVARNDPSYGLQIVAYFIPKHGKTPSGKILKEYLKARLPEYMLPAHCLRLAAFPLTPNGKVDRKALPASAACECTTESGAAMPSSALETKVASIWRSLLKLDRIGVDDNFFDLGGHSLLAVQLEAHLKRDIDDNLKLIHIFQYPTIRSLTAYIEKCASPDVGMSATYQSKRLTLSKQRRSRINFKGQAGD
jgi:acyl carrier protein